MRPKKDNEVKEAQLDPGYLSPRKMPWPDSISLIRESWISQLEFLVNTEAREYQDDGLDGEKGWLSFFFLPFFFLTKKKIDFSIQIIFFFWKNLSIFYILLFRWNFEEKNIPLSQFNKSYFSIFSLFSFTNYTLEKIHKIQHKILSCSRSFS